MWECAVHSWLCNKWGSQTWLLIRNTWEASNILMPEPPPGDSVSNQGTSGVILMRSQGTEVGAYKVGAAGVCPSWDVSWCIKIHSGSWTCPDINISGKQWK